MQLAELKKFIHFVLERLVYTLLRFRPNLKLLPSVGVQFSCCCFCCLRLEKYDC